MSVDTRSTSLGHEAPPRSLGSTWPGRLGLAASIVAAGGLFVPWAIVDGVPVPATGAEGRFGWVVVVVGAVAVVCAAVAVIGSRLRDPAPGPFAVGGIVAALAVVLGTAQLPDWVAERSFVGPAVTGAAAGVLVVVGASAGVRARRRVGAADRRPGAPPPEVAAPLRWLAPAVVTTVGLGLWLLGLWAPWLQTGEAPRAFLSGFAVPESVPMQVCLAVVVVAGGVACAVGGRALPALVVVVGASVAGIVLALRAGASLAVSTPVASLAPGPGRAWSILGAGLAAIGATWLVVAAVRAEGRRVTVAAGGAAAAVVAAAVLAAALVPIPTVGSPAGSGEVRVLTTGTDSPSPLRRTDRSGVGQVLVDGDQVYVLDWSAGGLLPVVGGRFGAVLELPLSSSSTLLGLRDGVLLFGADYGDVWATTLDRQADDDAVDVDTGRSLPAERVVGDVYEVAAGPDGALWFIDERGLRRIDDPVGSALDRPVELPAGVPLPDDLVGASEGRVLGRYDLDRRLVWIGADGTVTPVLGGVADLTCGASADPARTALPSFRRSVTDAAGNLWLATSEGRVLVVRAADGAVVDATDVVTAATASGDGSRAVPQEVVGAQSDGGEVVLALAAVEGPESIVVAVADPPGLAASLPASAPADRCQPMRAPDTAVPALRSVPRPPGDDPLTRPFTLPPDVTIAVAGGSATVTWPDGSALIDDGDLVPYGSYGRAADGTVWWTAESGRIGRATRDGAVVGFEPPTGRTYVDVEPTASGAVALSCGPSSCHLDALAVDGAVTEGPSFSVDDDQTWYDIAGTDPTGRFVVVALGDVGSGRVDMRDGTIDRLATIDDRVLDVAADGSVIVRRDDGAIVAVGLEDERELVPPSPPGAPPTFELLRRGVRVDEPGLAVIDAVVDVDGTAYVLTYDLLLLAIDADGALRYLAGGGPFVEGANGSLAGASEVELVGGELAVRRPGETVLVPIGAP